MTITTAAVLVNCSNMSLHLTAGPGDPRYDTVLQPARRVLRHLWDEQVRL